MDKNIDYGRFLQDLLRSCGPGGIMNTTFGISRKGSSTVWNSENIQEWFVNSNVSFAEKEKFIDIIRSIKKYKL